VGSTDLPGNQSQQLALERPAGARPGDYQGGVYFAGDLEDADPDGFPGSRRRAVADCPCTLARPPGAVQWRDSAAPGETERSEQASVGLQASIACYSGRDLPPVVPRGTKRRSA
jgi:hypothetical protein